VDPARKAVSRRLPLEEAGIEPSVTRKITDAVFETVLFASRHFRPPERPRLASREGQDESMQTGSSSCRARCGEPGLVHQLIAQPAVEAFGKSILHRLCGWQCNPTDPLVDSGQDPVEGQLGAVSETIVLGPAADHDERSSSCSETQPVCATRLSCCDITGPARCPPAAKT